MMKWTFAQTYFSIKIKKYITIFPASIPQVSILREVFSFAKFKKVSIKPEGTTTILRPCTYAKSGPGLSRERGFVLLSTEGVLEGRLNKGKKHNLKN